MNQVWPYLFFLSCPLSMGVMMWVMTRSMQGSRKDETRASDPRVAQLEREVQALREAQQSSNRESVEMN
jgi:hypothetical protein